MKKTVAALLVTFVLATPALAKVEIEYDHAYPIGSVKTFAWITTEEHSLKDPLFHSQVVNALEHYLTQAGIREIVEGEKPDVLVTYKVEREITRREMHTRGSGYPPTWSGGDPGTHAYATGTIIVDVWSPKTNNLIWRGSTSEVVPTDPDRDLVSKKIDKAMAKLIKEWGKIKKRRTK